MTDILSEARVIIGQYQQITSVDLSETSQIAQGTTDNVVANCLVAGSAYAGLTASASGTTGVTIQPGYLLQAGKGYSLFAAETIDLSPQIALVGDSTKSMIVLILADGDESTSSETRTFEDASKKPTNPADLWPTVQTFVSTRSIRSIDLEKVAGASAVQPASPAYNASLCLIATAVVSNSQVLSVSQNTSQQLTRLDQIVPVVSGLSGSVASLQSLTAGLLSSVSSLALAVSSLTSQFLAAIADLQSQINALKAKSSAAATSTFLGQDNFQNLNMSNPAASGYNAIVSSGLRFGTANHNDTTYAPATPFNSTLQQNTGSLLYPLKTDSIFAQIYGDRWLYFGLTTGTGLTVNLNNVGLYTGTTFSRYFGRQRTRMSPGLPASSASQVLQSGDPSQLFGLDGSGFVYDATDWGSWTANNPSLLHLAGFWNDISAHGFWTPGASGLISGLPIASQPFTPATPGMLTEIDFASALSGFNSNNPPPALRVIFCADNNGQPDFTNVYADVMATSPDANLAGVLKAVMPSPIYFRGGKKYHIVTMLTNSAVGVSLDTANYSAPNGSNPSNQSTINNSSGSLASISNDWLQYINGTFAAASPGRCMAITIYTANFASNTVRVGMQPLTLAGGFDTIDQLAYALIPDGCQVTYEVYAGGQWLQLSAANLAAIFAGSPQSLPMNMVLQGTTSLMPVIDATAGRSTSRASKGSASLDHVSSIQAPSGTVTKIHKSVTIQGWNPATQTLTADLRTGTGYATVVQPDSSPLDVTNTDGTLTRSWTWTLGTPVPTFEMELIGALTNTGTPFVVSQSNWDAGN